MNAKTIAVIGAARWGGWVGLDVRLNIFEYLHSTLGGKYRSNERLRQYVKEGRLGRKTGRGVYEYPQQKVAERKG